MNNPLAGLREIVTKAAAERGVPIPPMSQGPGRPPGGMRLPPQLVEGRYKSTLLSANTPFLFLPEREPVVASILGGGRYYEATERAKHVQVRRVLDVGAAEGAFACWAFVRWPGAWIDMIENDPDFAALARRNGPPGSTLLERRNLDLGTYDVVRIASREAASLVPLALEGVPLVIVDFSDSPTDEERERRKGLDRAAKLEAWERAKAAAVEAGPIGTAPPPVDLGRACSLCGVVEGLPSTTSTCPDGDGHNWCAIHPFDSDHPADCKLCDIPF